MQNGKHRTWPLIGISQQRFYFKYLQNNINEINRARLRTLTLFNDNCLKNEY